MAGAKHMNVRFQHEEKRATNNGTDHDGGSGDALLAVHEDLFALLARAINELDRFIQHAHQVLIRTAAEEQTQSELSELIAEREAQVSKPSKIGGPVLQVEFEIGELVFEVVFANIAGAVEHI